MITGHGHWTLGMYIGIPILAIVLLAGVVCILTALFVGGERFYDEERAMVGISGVIVIITAASVLGFGYFPWKTDYHRYSVVEGTVAESNSRLISNGDKGVSQRIVIRFNESDQLFGCDDTRCALATVGKHVRLNCIKEYQWNSQPGWACKYGQSD